MFLRRSMEWKQEMVFFSFRFVCFSSNFALFHLFYFSGSKTKQDDGYGDRETGNDGQSFQNGARRSCNSNGDGETLGQSRGTGTASATSALASGAREVRRASP